MTAALSVPTWLTVVAGISLALALICALVIAIDVWRRPQPMTVMSVVWPVTALFGSVLWLAAYWRWGRAPRPNLHPGPRPDPHPGPTPRTAPSSATMGEMGAMSMTPMDAKMSMAPGSKPMNMGSSRPFPVSVFLGTCHCGAGCTLADLAVEWLLFAVPSLLVLGGYPWLFSHNLFAHFVLTFVAAYLVGITFQYWAITSMKQLGRRQAWWAAIKADTLSLTSWQVGMYLTMALGQLWLFPAWFGGPVAANTALFWLLMQVAMLVGFATAYPMNWFLIRRGIKEQM
ncbi:DUF4396 domain-containing protein [Scrofimicrobium sp. R131]|uniref:DUF4396 domain-containing protein n=1 Tax=Scrofimicrobium appendicitidis TaxID=3079930 RepID=A0AAU7V953_9ACTO